MASFAEIERVLKNTNMGVIALAIHKKKNVTLAYRTAGPPASYRADINTCTLNTSLPLLVVASYFVHEMHHAIANLTGRSADPTQLDKGTYVSRMLAEEAKGTALGYEVYLNFEESGLADGQPAPPNFHYYRSAYRAGREKFGREHSGAAEPELRAAGLEAAAKQMHNLVNAGFFGPDQWMNYETYYKIDWDKANRP